MFEVTDSAAKIDLSEEAMRAMMVSSEAMNSVCYLCNAFCCDLEELHDTGTVEEVVETIELLLCEPPYNVKRRS